MTLLNCCDIFVSGRLGDSVAVEVCGTGGKGANLLTEGSLGVGKRSVAGVGGGDPVDCCGSVSWLCCQRFCNARNS